MNYPTPAEIRMAYDGITADGPVADATTMLCALVITNPLLRETMDRLSGALIAKRKITDPVSPAGKIIEESLITSAIATGLNYALRIADIRQAGMKSRASVESLIAHLKSGECTHHGTDECREEIVVMLEWVLGKSAAPTTGDNAKGT